MDCPVCEGAELQEKYDSELKCPNCGEVFNREYAEKLGDTIVRDRYGKGD